MDESFKTTQRFLVFLEFPDSDWSCGRPAETLSEMRETIIGFLSIISLGADFIVSETRRVTVTVADGSCYVYQRRGVFSQKLTLIFFSVSTIIDWIFGHIDLHEEKNQAWISKMDSKIITNILFFLVNQNCRLKICRTATINVILYIWLNSQWEWVFLRAGKVEV